MGCLRTLKYDTPGDYRRAHCRYCPDLARYSLLVLQSKEFPAQRVVDAHSTSLDWTTTDLQSGERD